VIDTTAIVSLAAPLIVQLLERPEIADALRRALGTDAPAPAQAPPTLLTKAQLARELGVSSATIDRHDAAGAPVERVGARKRYVLETRRAWLAERGRFVSTSPPKAKPLNDDTDVSSVVARAGLRLVSR
jgi:hypothetical protein